MTKFGRCLPISILRLTERNGSSAVFDRARENGRRFYTISQDKITNLLPKELAKITLITDYDSFWTSAGRNKQSIDKNNEINILKIERKEVKVDWTFIWYERLCRSPTTERITTFPDLHNPSYHVQHHPIINC